MKKLVAIVRSMRLRTLPLSLAGVLLGLLTAFQDGYGSWGVILTVLLTTISLQILSNLSNELGDYLHGTDTPDRQGPTYSLQAGALREKDIKRTIVVMMVLCSLCGIIMVWHSFGTLFSLPAAALLCLGACAIWAAMRYTLGKKPYGYRGLGDLFVFLFFGLVSVGGAYYVAAHKLPLTLIYPAAAIGCFSVGVLNVNNIRDIKTDAGTRMTIPLKIGEKPAKIYQTCLILCGWLFMVYFTINCGTSWWNWLFVLTLPLFIMHLHGVWHRSHRQLDAMLPLLVMSTFVLVILVGIGNVIVALS